MAVLHKGPSDLGPEPEFQALLLEELLSLSRELRIEPEQNAVQVLQDSDLGTQPRQTEPNSRPM